MAKKYIERKETKPLRPATTPEGRENQLINLATNLVEERLRNGTATSQETTFYLKLGSEKEKLEREKLKREIDLLSEKKKALESAERSEQLFTEAIAAMKRYQGNDDEQTVD